MTKFRYEQPSIARKDDAIDYIKEHLEYKSNINGTGSLDSYYEDYQLWLDILNNRKNLEYPNPDFKVPSLTYFLVRSDDNKIVGMCNIRTKLNSALKFEGGHIGYGIRPTERNKGYNKINLYIALKLCKKLNIDEILLDADVSNVASWKTMEALGGIRIKEYIGYDQTPGYKYKIDVNKSLDEYSDIYEQYVEDEYENKRVY